MKKAAGLLLFRFGYVCCLRSLLALDYFELNAIAFLKALVAFRRNRAVMHKDIGTTFASDKPVAFCVVEPLYCAFQSFHLRPLGHVHCVVPVTLFAIVRPLNGAVKKTGRVSPAIYAALRYSGPERARARQL